jgi:hypothetical protein
VAKVVEELQVLIKQHGAKEVTRAMKGMEKQTDSNVKSLAKLAAGYVGIRALWSGAKGLTNLYAQQEMAEQRLEARTRRLGDVTGVFAERLKQEASAMQRVSMFGDEVWMSTQRLLLDLGANSDNITKATKATGELAAALDMDLNSAARLVGQALSGNVQTLARYIPAVRDLTKAEIDEGKALDLVLEKLGGSMKSQEGTVQFATEQLSMAASDLGEEVMKPLAPLIRDVALALAEMAAAMKKAGELEEFWALFTPDSLGGGVVAGLKMIAEAKRQAADLRKEALSEQKAFESKWFGLDIPLVGAGKKKTKPKGKGGTDDLAAALAGGEDWGGSDAALAAWRDLEYGKLEIDEEAQAARTDLWFQSTIDRLDAEQAMLDEMAIAHADNADLLARQWDQQFGQQWKQMAQGMGQVWGQLWMDIVSDQKNAGKQLLAGILGVMGDWAISEGSIMMMAALAEAVPTKGASLAGLGPAAALIAAGGILKGGQALTQGHSSGLNYGAGGSFSQAPGASQQRPSVDITVNYSGLGYDKGAIGAEIHDALGRAEKEGRI